jgi:PqqD family protein of HPr-rel-A system
MEIHRRYRLAGSRELKLFTFDDEVAAFNPVTWDTHLLDASAAVVLKALARAPATSAAIEHLLSADPAASDSDAARLTTALLGELAAVGLIEPEPVDPPC